MTVEFNDKEFRKKIRRRELSFLHGVGKLGVNQAVQISHVDTGLSRNAKHYVVDTGFSSKFGDLPGEDGKIRQPPEGIKGTRPKEKGSVKIVAPLKYDIYLERRYAILKRSLDLIRPGIRKIGRILLKT